VSQKLAMRVKESFDELDPLIEKYTSRVCPSCDEPCCKDIHCRYVGLDIVYLDALGGDIDERVIISGKNNEEGALRSVPCRHLAEKGCVLPRHLRPYRCTWYFCSRLLDAIGAEPPREYRAFVDALRRLAETRLRLQELP